MEFEFSVLSVRSGMKRDQLVCHDLSASSRKDKTLIAEAGINVSALFNFFIQVIFETLFERDAVKVYFFEIQTRWFSSSRYPSLWYIESGAINPREFPNQS